MEEPGTNRRHKTEKTDTTEQVAAGRALLPAKLGFWLIVAVASIVRLFYFVQYVGSPLMGSASVDELYYMSWAARIASGDWLGSQVFEQGPLYAYLLALEFRVSEGIATILVPQMLTGIVVVLLVYDSARRLFDQTTAVAAGLIAATFGPFVFYECMIMKSFLSPLLTMIALNAGLRYGLEQQTDSVPPQDASNQRVEDRDGLLLAVAGAAVGLSCLIQEYHALLLLPLGAWTWMSNPSGTTDAPSRRSRATRIAVLTAAALLCILPFTVRNWVVAREFVMVTAGGGEVFYMAQGPQARGVYHPPDFMSGAVGREHEDFRREAIRRAGRELSHAESSRYWFREGLRSIAANPARTVQLTLSKAAIMINDYEVPDSQSYAATRRFVPVLRVLTSFGWLGGLSLVGMAICFRTKQFMLPLGMVIAHAAPILIFYNFGRFRLGGMPLWIIFAAHATVWIVRKWRDATLSRRWHARLVFVAALAISVGMYHPFVARSYRVVESIKVASAAVRVQDYTLAEEELRGLVKILNGMRSDQPAPVLSAVQKARVWQLMGYVCVRTGRPQEAIEHVLALRRLSSALDDVREHSLKTAFVILLELLSDQQMSYTSTTRVMARAELSEVCAELRQVRPGGVAFWAVGAANLRDSADAAEIEQGLDAAWQAGADEDPTRSHAWYLAGKALLAHHNGDGVTARALALRALSDWPGHPLVVELRTIPP
jgi:4-amino-4-deoxy-L-arabinose transferase-like glycosyltransferase